MLIGGGVLALVLLLVWVFALFDVVATPADQVRNLPKLLWFVLVLLLGGLLIGPVLWLVAGRPRLPGAGPRSPKAGRGLRGAGAGSGEVSRPTALRPPSRSRPGAPLVPPDPDRELLLALKKSNEEHEEMLRRWENDLRGREEALRRERAALAGKRPDGTRAGDGAAETGPAKGDGKASGGAGGGAGGGGRGGGGGGNPA